MKKLFLAALAAVMLAAAPVRAQSVGTLNTVSVVPLGYQQITGLSTAKGLTIPNGARYAVVIPETQAIRYRDDGTAPTAAVGMPIAALGVLIYEGTLSKIQFIEQTASAKLNVLYYR